MVCFFSYIQSLLYAQARIIPTTTASKWTGILQMPLNFIQLADTIIQYFLRRYEI